MSTFNLLLKQDKLIGYFLGIKYYYNSILSGDDIIIKIVHCFENVSSMKEKKIYVGMQIDHGKKLVSDSALFQYHVDIIICKLWICSEITKVQTYYLHFLQ